MKLIISSFFFFPFLVGHLIFSTFVITISSCWYFNGSNTLVGCWRPVASRFEQNDVRSLLPVETETDDLQDHIIICGFGRVGQIIAQLLSEQLIPFVAFDVKCDRVAVGRALDLPVYFGDAGSKEVVHKVGADRACAAAVGLDTPGANYRTVWQLSKYFPNVKTFVRAHDVDHGINLEKAGVSAAKLQHQRLLSQSMSLDLATSQSLPSYVKHAEACLDMDFHGLCPSQRFQFLIPTTMKLLKEHLQYNRHAYADHKLPTVWMNIITLDEYNYFFVGKLPNCRA